MKYFQLYSIIYLKINKIDNLFIIFYILLYLYTLLKIYYIYLFINIIKLIFYSSVHKFYNYTHIL